MKKLYTILFLLAFGTAPLVNAQTTLFSEDFESSYTHDTDITGFNGWQSWGTAAPTIIKSINSAGQGADGSDWYADESNAVWTVLARNYDVITGEEYTFKLKSYKTGAGAAKLQVNSTAIESSPNNVADSWQDLEVTFTATEDASYSFRFIHIWGAGTFKIDDVEITCNTCATMSVDDQQAFEFYVYPIPAKNELNINTQVELQNARVHNLLGKMVLNIIEPSNRINVSSLNSGIYMLTLTSKEGAVVNKKIIIE